MSVNEEKYEASLRGYSGLSTRHTALSRFYRLIQSAEVGEIPHNAYPNSERQDASVAAAPIMKLFGCESPLTETDLKLIRKRVELVDDGKTVLFFSEEGRFLADADLSTQVPSCQHVSMHDPDEGTFVGLLTVCD